MDKTDLAVPMISEESQRTMDSANRRAVASALHQPPGRDPCGQTYPNMPFPPCLSNQDTSTWQKLGHFYLALTDGFPKLYLSHTVQG
jgi:hypothetical protein